MVRYQTLTQRIQIEIRELERTQTVLDDESLLRTVVA